MNLIDNIKHQGKRKRLIQELKDMGIESSAVLNAMLKVPRHYFLDSSFEDFAYQNKAFPIATEQTISHPYTVAFQTEMLNIKKDEKVLEIGTGSGYQTAVLFHLGAEVHSIERQHILYDKTKLLLNQMRINASLYYGDGFEGLTDKAPFDKIIVTAGAPYVPKPLLAQLKIGGMLLIPVGDKTQIMTLFTRTSPKEFDKQELGDFAFVPMLESKN